MKKLLFLYSVCLFHFSLNAQTTTYLWSNGATTSSLSVSPSVTTTYHVTITHGGEQYYDSLVVTVNPNPSAPTISTTAASCSSAGTATVTNYDASSTYTFSPTGPSVGAGGVISGLTPATTYTVTATNATSCSSPASTSFSVDAQLLSNTASAASSSPTVCSNNALTNITHSTTGATGIGTTTGLPTDVSVSWSNNTITISGTPTVAGTYNYSIPLTGGCGTVNATGTITVTSPNTPTFTQVGPYLSGASIPALPTTSTNGISGTWSPAISNTTTSTYTFTPSVGQCGTTTTMTITINEPLQYTLTANDSSVCAGTTVTLSVNIQSPNTTVTDIDGNVYPIVVIGNQIWMTENLRTTKYNDGSNIILADDDIEWTYNLYNNAKIPMMCWYENDQLTYTSNKFGALYNWYTINPITNDNRNICPSGWHVPSHEEFTTLINFLGEPSDAGGKMKTTGTIYWESPNSDATNESGFSGLPGGWRGSYGDFGNTGIQGVWWSSDEFNSLSSWIFQLFFWSGDFAETNGTKEDGYSVRCLKD